MKLKEIQMNFARTEMIDQLFCQVHYKISRQVYRNVTDRIYNLVANRSRDPVWISIKSRMHCHDDNKT